MVLDYKRAGVDIAAGEQLVDWLRESQPKDLPHQERLVSGIGGFASVFRAQFPEMKKPCLVSATDGVGTKLKWAIELGRYSGIGQDLVAMCVNDLICCGGQPLFFLDYYAVGKLELESAKLFLEGVRTACIQSNCLLIGGETAEMPGIYRGKDFDCAGFALGVVDEEEVLGSHRVSCGDNVLGVSSSGFHANGFSLLRKLFEKDYADYAEVLMEPTALYPSLALRLQRDCEIHAMAHITGGGIDNLRRVLPKGLGAKIKAWSLPEIYSEVFERSGLSIQEMRRTFNSGIGLMIILPESSVSTASLAIEEQGFEVFNLGSINEDSGEESPLVIEELS